MTGLLHTPEKRGFLELAVRRLSAYGLLGPDDEAVVRGLRSSRSLLRPGEVLIQNAGKLHLVLDGWGCLMSSLPDGRRQILDLVLPGDPVRNPADVASEQLWVRWEALTNVILAEADALNDVAAIRTTLQMDREMLLARRCHQIMRLGALTAYQRIGHLLLELHARQAEIGMVEGGRFRCPLSQKTIGEVLGLTGAHVNRTFRQMKADGMLAVGEGWLALPDQAALAKQAWFYG